MASVVDKFNNKNGDSPFKDAEGGYESEEESSSSSSSSEEFASKNAASKAPTTTPIAAPVATKQQQLAAPAAVTVPSAPGIKVKRVVFSAYESLSSFAGNNRLVNKYEKLGAELGAIDGTIRVRAIEVVAVRNDGPASLASHQDHLQNKNVGTQHKNVVTDAGAFSVHLPAMSGAAPIDPVVVFSCNANAFSKQLQAEYPNADLSKIGKDVSKISDQFTIVPSTSPVMYGIREWNAREAKVAREKNQKFSLDEGISHALPDGSATMYTFKSETVKAGINMLNELLLNSVDHIKAEDLFFTVERSHISTSSSDKKSSEMSKSQAWVDPCGVSSKNGANVFDKPFLVQIEANIYHE